MLKGLSKWKVLNSKEIKAVAALVKQQWGCGLNLGCGFLEGNDGDIFLISRDVERLDLEQLNLESLGLYFGQLRNDELRLSIEGSQIVGKTAAKNVVELTGEEFRQWIGGNAIPRTAECTIGRSPICDIEKNVDGCSGYVIVKRNTDFIGCGKCKEGKILNFVPKARRIRA